MIEYPIIILFSILGMVFLILSNDLISTFLALELQSLSLYILATSYAPSRMESTSAGLKYFILGSLSTGFILLGFSLIYGLTGVTDYESLSLIFGASVSFIHTMPVLWGMEYNAMTWALIIMGIGLLFKISAAPFHNWAPDVYDEVPTIITMWLTIMPKISIIIFILQFFGGTLLVSTSYDITYALSTLLLISAILSMLLGSIVGLAQVKIKRLLAYSTISHIGFLLLALSMIIMPSIDHHNTTMASSSNIVGSLIFYLIQYSLTNLIIFYVLIVRQSNTHHQDITSYISDMRYWLSDIKYNYSNISLSISFFICMFSLAGIPPLIGFYGKQMILSIALSNGLVIPSIIAILTSVISAAYYLKLISATMNFSGSTTNSAITSTNIPHVNSIISFIISFILIIVIIGMMFFDPTLLLDMIIN